MPNVSVIMSVYNAEKHLKVSVDSILTQTYQDFEFIIINDGSTDKTPAILDSYRDSRLILLTQENNGLTRSLNRGIKIAQGKYIARQDAGDVSLPDRLEHQVQFLESNQEIALLGTYAYKIDEEGNEIGMFSPPSLHREIRNCMLRKKKNPFVHGTLLFRKDCLPSGGFYRPEFENAQDFDLCLRVSESYKVHILDRPLYKWRLERNSLSVKKALLQNRYRQLALRCAKERGKGRGDEGLLKNFVNKDYSNTRKPLFKDENDLYHFSLATLYFDFGNYKKSREIYLKLPFIRRLNFRILIKVLLTYFPAGLLDRLRKTIRI
ncbi:glycosyltransferase family 2 protein [Thermodesulfobacteriota bacterium]